MNIVETIMQKLFIIDKEPQRVGLSQLNSQPIQQKQEPSIKNKDIKLSDLMRRAS